LTGRHPYATTNAPPREVERRIVEVEPERPSSAVLHATAAAGDGPHPTAERVAAARGTTPKRLRSRLRGDLNTIVLKALRKDTARRYVSAQQLGEDVERHLERGPVLAQRDTVSYRTAKFVRRNRVALLALSSVVAAGSQRLERELTDQPEVRASMMSTIGRVYSNLGRFDARSSVRRTRTSLAHSPNWASSLGARATIRPPRRSTARRSPSTARTTETRTRPPPRTCRTSRWPSTARIATPKPKLAIAKRSCYRRDSSERCMPRRCIPRWRAR